MEKWRNGINIQPPQRCRDHPSFSSTLLDAIYRSIDETDNLKSPNDQSSKKQNPTTCFTETRIAAPPAIRAPAISRRPTATSSSSDASSYSSFSSSDTESPPTLHPTHLRPIRTAFRSNRFYPIDHPVQPASSKADGKIRSCLRDSKGLRSPSSPAARIASFLTSIFAAKSNAVAESEDSRRRPSRLSKTPAAKRTVRFCTGGGAAGGNLRSSPWRSKVDEKGEEEEEDDLFELKNLAVRGRMRDELPVYETTRVGKYGGVARGVVV